jgi:hypothetical protein
MSSEKRWIRLHAFERLVPPFEDCALPESCCDNSQRLRDPVILLDERSSSSGGFADGREEVEEVIPFVKHQRAPHSRAAGSAARGPKS